MGTYCYVAVCSAASAPTEGGEGRGHIVAVARLQLVIIIIIIEEGFRRNLLDRYTGAKDDVINLEHPQP